MPGPGERRNGRRRKAAAPAPTPPRRRPDGNGQADRPFDLDAALTRIGDRKRALIVMHDNPDPDSLASGEGLRTLFSHELDIPSTLALGGIIGRAENRAVVAELHIPLVPMEELAPERFDLVALVDTQPQAGNNSLPDSVHADIIIDHHPPRDHHPGATWTDIRSSLGASSTIVYEYLRAKGIPLDSRLATLFLYAIKSETRDLGREASPAERAAYLELVQLADHGALYRIANPKHPREHFAALDRAVRSARLHGDLLALNLGRLDYPDLVAEVADLMLSFEGARWVVCVGYYRQAVFLSIRTEVEHAHAGGLIRRVVGRDGAAGGHGMIAGGRLFARVSSDAALAPLYDQIVRNVCRELGRSSDRSVPLLDRRPARK
jgi:nanoRNase/pAp phosphatase (c-di-AMP/oligoRNAs hydrolase)